MSEMTGESYNDLIDKIKKLLLDNMYETESDNNWSDYKYLPEEKIRELMDGLYTPPRLNILCKYEYSCGMYGNTDNCKGCVDNISNRDGDKKCLK
jgi:hypothetical protein